MSCRALLPLLGFVMVACGSGAPTPPSPGSGVTPDPMFAAGPPKDNTPTGLCSRLCTKALRCLGVGETELAACTTSCAAQAPEQAKVEQLEAGDCQQVLAVLNNPKGGAAAGPAPAANGCTADCRGCVGDGTSCYAVAGGANGIPCDSCCCAPGGASPTWKTE